MNRLVIIGNGFDMAHGLKTSYMDFINWYWERRLNAMLTEHASISEGNYSAKGHGGVSSLK